MSTDRRGQGSTGVLRWLRRGTPTREAPAVTEGVNASESEPATGLPDGDAVVVAETKYSSLVRRASGRALLAGGSLAILQATLAWWAQLDAVGSEVAISPVTLAVEHGRSALVVLLPVALAFQVLLRMPRDPESTELEDAIAHRQFWGTTAGLLAVIVAYVAVSTLVHAFLLNTEANTLDVVQLFGVPAGAALTLLLYADAETMADLEAEKLSLPSSRSDQALRRVQAGIDRIPGRAGQHPKRALATRGTTVAVAAIAGGTWVTHAMVGDLGLTVVYVVFSAILSLFVVASAVRVITSAVQSQILDTLMSLLLPSLVAFVLVLEGVVAALQVSWRDLPIGYFTIVGYGLLLPAPSILVVVALVTPLGRREVAPPLLAVSRASLEGKVQRMQNLAPTKEPKPWRTLACLAIVTCPLPLAAFPLMILATWQRREVSNPRSGLMIVGWALVTFVAMLELAVLLLLAYFGPTLERNG